MLKQRNEGYWFYPVKEFVYDKEYINKYKGYEKTDTGKKLNNLRCNLIKQYNTVFNEHLDVGIGSGILVKELFCYGYDVNPTAIEFLKRNKRYLDLYKDNLPVKSISFFDSLEHIYDLNRVFAVIGDQVVIISIPIYNGEPKDLKEWKHYREDEHFHYFTDACFKKFVKGQGFTILEENKIEQEAGRSDINTYIIKRVKHG